MRAASLLRVVLPACAVAALAGCSAPTSAAADAASIPLTVGSDLDERQPRELHADYQLPAAFDQALKDLSVADGALTFPDNGLTAAFDPTRLHWTDLLRHQGRTGPTFAHMVATDVEAALALGDTDAAVRELLVAQNTLQLRSAFQVSRFDRAITVASGGQPLLGALRDFYAHPPVQGDPAPARPPWGDVEAGVTAQVAKVPAELQVPLAQCILGLLVAADLRDQALAGGGKMSLAEWATFSTDYMTERGTPAGLTLARNASKTVDFDLLSRAGQVAVRSIESLRLALEAAPLPGARVDLTGPLGRIALALDGADDEWKGGDFFLLVDAAGNDTYLGDTAANLDVFHPVSVVLDLAGNDRYQPSETWDISDGYLPDAQLDTSARQAAGLFGVAVLDDAAGDDHYKCPHFCQGSGLFGVGVMIDRGGDDVYQGYDLSQGAAQFGFGLLVDTGGGKDRYETLQTSQGYGDTRGIGWIVDDGGDDSYLAIEDPIIYEWAGEGTNWSGSQGFGFGNRQLPGGPYLSGGLGGLFDLGGNDTYQCAVMCQGFGYFFGTGLFYDKQGNDTHVVTHKYGIGGATHQSVGLFLDEQGSDSYTYAGHGRTGGGEGVGLGYDLGVAYHIDRGKEADTYSFPVDIGWIMGFARHPALGVLINEGGDDHYTITGQAGARSLGASEVMAGDRDSAGSTISLGMFLDLGGADTYQVMRTGPANHATWIQTDPIGDGWDRALDHAYGFDSE